MKEEFITFSKSPEEIMDKRIKISVCGCSQDVVDIVYNNLKGILLFDVKNSDDFSDCDIIYWIFGKGPSIKNNFSAWIRKDPIIINHWIGSDVIHEIRRNRQGGLSRIKNCIQDFIFYRKRKMGGLINLTSAPWLVNELSVLDIGATYLAITTIDLDELETFQTNLPKDIDFLSYVPFRSFGFYGGEKILKLAERWQDYTFFLICVDLDEIPSDFMEKIPKNVILSPRVNRSKMIELYKRSKFLIRYTQHDAISLSVLEALYFKLQVLWTYEFPFTQKIRSYEELSGSIADLVQNWSPNEDGYMFVRENYSTEEFRKRFIKIVQYTKNKNSQALEKIF
jgi:hypothetical protein